ncbi:hypothetical protein [Helicobacter sp. MIT 05-5294]|uniref:hypothetical protein n=1 Tax=Helicobacter sp. MIT 05-5294 TaxID=1548150 RepID=UPI00051F8FF4|nr:hypothetical protein [Helicobacter sp. MIT 05-5294]TLD85806.1 hypothetical protein LS69_007880 [Helicobacter sp. MIT 05-5294]
MILKIDDLEIFDDVSTINLSPTPNQTFKFEYDYKTFEITIRYFNDVVSVIDCVIDNEVEFEHGSITCAYLNLMYLTRKYPDIAMWFAFNPSIKNSFTKWDSDIVQLCVGKINLEKLSAKEKANDL